MTKLDNARENGFYPVYIDGMYITIDLEIVEKLEGMIEYVASSVVQPIWPESSHSIHKCAAASLIKEYYRSRLHE